MSNETLQAIGAALGIVIVAALTYIAAWVRANAKAIAAHSTALALLVPPRPPGNRRATDPAGGGGAGRPAPLWNQLADPLSTGGLPAWRYEECGEECVAEILYAQHGVEVSADALRAQLGGPGRRGLTTARDLSLLLTRNNVACSILEVGADNVAAQLRAATAAGRSAIVLGHWLAPAVLHWVLVTRADAIGCGYNDPWGGRRIAVPWSDFTPRFAGDVVLVLRTPDAGR